MSFMLFHTVFPYTQSLSYKKNVVQRILINQKRLIQNGCQNTNSLQYQEQLTIRSQINTFNILMRQKTANVPILLKKYFLSLPAFQKCRGKNDLQKVLYQQLAKSMCTCDNQQLVEFFIQNSNQNQIQIFEISKLAPFIFDESRMQYNHEYTHQINLNIFEQDGYLLSYTFSQDNDQIKSNGAFIVENILKQIIAFRIFQSLSTQTAQQNLQEKQNKFILQYQTKIIFVLDFNNYNGNILQWARDVGQFCLVMLRRIQKQYNVEFIFACCGKQVSQNIGLPAPFMTYRYVEESSETCADSQHQMDIQ